MEPILVTCAIIKHNERYLLTQRKKGNKNELRWEFPGGKVEAGEEPKESIVREMREELGVDVKPLALFDESEHYYSHLDMHVRLLAIRCEIIGGRTERLDVEEYKWLHLEEMDDYDITEADRPFVEKLKLENENE